MVRLGWTVRLGCVATLACSPAAAPGVQEPAPAPEVAAPAAVAAPAVVAEVAAPTQPGCVAPAEATAEAGPRAWQLAATATRERPALVGAGPRVFVSARKRLYDAGPGEPLAASTTHAAGLTKHAVVQMLGTWPDDAWLVTFEGAMTRGGGGHKFHVWRWSADRWVRQTRAPIVGDGVAEVFRWTPGHLLELRCEGRPELAFVAHGGAVAPAPLRRASATSFCPLVFVSTGSGDLLAVDQTFGTPPDVRAVERCAGCDAARESALPVPQPCGAPTTTSVWGLRAVRTLPSREPVLVMHTGTTDEQGASRRTGTFLLRRAAEGWDVEAIPERGPVDAVAAGPDGALWVASDRLLRRDALGAWTEVAPPPGTDGPGDDLGPIVVAGDEVWLVVETNRDETTAWSVHRTGPPGRVIDLDSRAIPSGP